MWIIKKYNVNFQSSFHVYSKTFLLQSISANEKCLIVTERWLPKGIGNVLVIIERHITKFLVVKGEVTA